MANQLYALVGFSLTLLYACADDPRNGQEPAVPPATEVDAADAANPTLAAVTPATEVALPTAYRITQAKVVDPSLVSLFVDSDAINASLATELSHYRLNLVLTFSGSPTSSGTSLTLFDEADCTKPTDANAMAACTKRAPALWTSPLTGKTTDTCFAPAPGTYAIDAESPSAVPAPCFAAQSNTLTLNIGDLSLPLSHISVAATHAAQTVPMGLQSGIIAGFLSKQNAPFLVSSILDPAAQDTVEGVVGWWIYVAFTASQIDWTE